MAEEITIESLLKINIKNLALNKNFGRLTFKSSYPCLEKIRDLFKELEEFDYKNILSRTEIESIDRRKEQFIQFLNRLQQFDIGQVNPQEVHDQLEKEIENFYHDTMYNSRTSLIFLRQDAALKSKDTRDLQKQQKETVRARKEYERLADELRQELDSLHKQKREVETAHGEVATKVLAHHFAKQANDYTTEAKNWLRLRSIFYWFLIAIVGLNFIAYFVISICNQFGKLEGAGDIFTIRYGIIKLFFISLLYLGLSFASRNYNIFANLEAVSRQRKNVAQTLEDFLATKPDNETRSQMIKQGTEAMFKHLSTGYIPKSEQKEKGQVYEIINNIMRTTKE